MAKRIPHKLLNVDELQKAYPEIVTERTVVVKDVDKEALYQIVKVNHRIGRGIPGVRIGEEQAPLPAGEHEFKVVGVPAGDKIKLKKVD